MLRKRTNRSNVNYINKFMIFPLIIFFGGLFLISNDLGIIRWYYLKKELNHIQNKIDKLIEEEAFLTQKLELLTNDKEYIHYTHLY